MRVVRRIHDSCRFARCESDLSLRERLKVVSIDCLLLRSRMRYLGRLMRVAPRALIAILQLRPGSHPLKWVQLICEDMLIMKQRVSLCSHLPDPGVDPNAWSDFVAGDPHRWSLAISCVAFCSSQLDSTACLDLPATRTVTCTVCGMLCADSKAMQQHRRIKHNVRSPRRYYVEAHGRCGACGTCFLSRLRLLAHLSDPRRPKCWKFICDYPDQTSPLSEERVTELDEADRPARREAQRQGMSHVKAIGPAVTVAGKLIGHVTR